MPHACEFSPATMRRSLAVVGGLILCICLLASSSVHGETLRVTDLSPAPGSILATPPAQVVLTFNNDLDPLTINPGALRLQRSGGDGSFSEGNEHYIYPMSVTATGPKEATLDFAGQELPDDVYRVVATQELAGHWKLDEDSGFLAHDSSGNGNDGVAIGDWTAGKIDGALQINGSSGKVKIHDAPALRIAGDLTVSLWFKKSGSWPGNGATLINKGTNGTGNYALYMESEFQHLIFQQLGQDTRNAFSLNSVASIQADQWYHVACVRQGEEARLYIDGSLDGSATVRTDPNPTDDPLAFGYSYLNFNMSRFEGQIDDVRIYARALSADEISNILTKEPGIADSNGQLLDGEFSGAFPSGDGVDGGDFLAAFEIRRPRLHAASSTVDEGAVLAQVPATIRVEMDQDVDPATLDTATARVLSPGGDGIFETADDVQIAPVTVQIPAGEDNVIELDLGGATMPAGPYQVRLSGNASGSALSFFERRHWVALPDSLITGLNVVTVECWFRTTRPGDLVYAAKSNGANAESLITVLSGGHLQAKLGEDFNYGLMYSSQRVDDGRWHHVAVVGNVDMQRLYVDGEWQGTLNVPLNLTAQTVNTIGGRVGAGIGNERFLGDVDEFRVWNVVRTEQQIRANMNRALAGDEAGLLAYYRLDEGTGTAISDATANGNDATVNGASPVWTAYGAPISGGLESVGGEAMDGEFQGVYPSGDGWPGGDFALNFEIQPDLMTVFDALPVPGSVLGASPDGLGFELSRAVDPTSLAGKIELVGRGNDDLLDTPDDVVVSLPAATTPTADQVSVDLSGTPLADDVYRMRLASNGSGALSFSGAQLVTLPDNLLQGHDQLTISIWFKTVTPGLILGVQQSVYPGLGGNQVTILAIGDDGRLYGELWVVGGSNPAYSEKSLVDGKWHHAALVAGRLDQALYVDGELVGRRREGGFDLLNMNHIQFGAGVGEGYPGGTNQWQYFKGQLDELRIWNYERSGELIKRDMHQRLVGTEPGLLAYYRMDEASGDTVIDSAGGNDGVLGGGFGDELKPKRVASGVPVAAGVRAADGGFLDGEFTGTFPSGNGVAGGNFDAIFSVNVSYTLPVAEDVEVSTQEDQILVGDFSATDADGGTLTYEILNQGTLGYTYVLVQPAGRFLYIPSLNANGQDEVTYRVFDGTGYSAPAQVTVNIQPVNDRPVALDFCAITAQGQGASIDLVAYDPDGVDLTFEVVEPAQHGELRGIFPDFDYVPDAGFLGTEDIIYRVFDGTAHSHVAHIVVVVDDTLTAPDVPQIYPSEFRALPGVSVTIQLLFFDPFNLDPLTNYAWTFGDGGAVAGADAWQVTHAYVNPGTYTAAVRLEFASGYFVIRTASVVIVEGPPVARIETDQEFGEVGVPMALDGSTSSDNQSELVDYEWTIEEQPAALAASAAAGRAVPQVLHGAQVEYTPAASGQLSVTLAVRNALGDEGSLAIVLPVFDDPTAHRPSVAIIKPVSGAVFGVNQPISFSCDLDDPDGDPVEASWDFGDGAAAEDEFATHAYAAEGIYDVTVTATDSTHLTNSDTIQVLVLTETITADASLNLQGGKFAIDWKKHAAGVSSDSISLKGYINPAGVLPDLSGATMEVVVNGMSLGEVTLDEKGKGTLESGGATIKAGLKTKNGAFLFTVTGTDLRSVIPLTNIAEAGNEELALEIIVQGAGLVQEDYSGRAVFAYSTKQDSKSTGKFGFKKNALPDGMFYVAKAAASQAKGSSDFSLALSGWFVLPEGLSLNPAGNVSLTLGGATLTLLQNTLTISANGISLTKGTHPFLGAFVMDTAKRTFTVKTNALGGTHIPTSGNSTVVHELPVRISVPTTDGLLTFESSVQIRRSSSTSTKWKR